jgi:nitrate/nitrite-specific signal transduction histidine kinase
MKANNISTKIRLIGTLFFILMISIVATTIFLNDKNEKDGLIINIAGKQRMLSQNIAKNIFYINQHKTSSINELDSSINEFIYNLNTLKNGNSFSKIKVAPNSEIANQLMKVEILWKGFHKNILAFKDLIQHNKNSKELDLVVDNIFTSNTNLLNEIDILVYLYTDFSEEKIQNIKNIQYLFAFLILVLILFSLLEVKKMEKNALKFLEETKKLMSQDINSPLKPINIQAESEIEDAANSLNNFIKKINLAMEDSTNAIIQSKNASNKLENLAGEFDLIIDELKNSQEISDYLNRSEDIAIESQEHLINSTKRLEELRKELEKIANGCETKL